MGNEREIKRAQKASQLYKTISELFLEASREDPRLQDLFVNRVELSPDKSVCWVYLYSAYGEEHFDELFPLLEKYLPSFRKAVAQRVPGRYTPELRFKFDTQLQKQLRVEQLLDELKNNNETS